jgi:type IV pilus assembly protein PilW
MTRRHVCSQCGWTLIELMIALTLGLLIMLTATGLLLSSKAAYIAQYQAVNVQETGRYAVQIVARAIRQAGYEHSGGEDISLVTTAEISANIAGYDAMTLKKSTAELQSPVTAGVVNGSDILAVRFFGDRTEGEEDGTILNCAGLTVPAVTSIYNAEQERGWSIFFVAKDSEGEPELRCKYQSKTGWNADAIARGVESFQVLYGIDANGGGLPTQFLNASEIDALDGKLQLIGDNAVERASDLNRKTFWKKIRAIRFALLVRGSEIARDDALADQYDLFGASYSAIHASDDEGVHIEEKSLSAATRNRIRKIFTQTIQLRNDAAGSGA